MTTAGLASAISAATVATLLASCGAHSPSPADPGHGGASPAAPALPPELAELAAYIPAHPTYAVVVRHVADVAGDRAVARVTPYFLDMLPSPRDLGIDVDAGAAMFSDELAPTFVVRLAAPAKAQQYVAQLPNAAHARVDGVDISTVAIPVLDFALSFAIDRDRLWIHAELAGKAASPPGAGGWLARSRAGGGAGALVAVVSSDRGAAVLGFADVGAIATQLGERAVAISPACVGALASVHSASFTVDLDPHGDISTALTIDLGDSAAALASAIVAPPAGFDAIGHDAPLAVQWNVDLGRAFAWAQQCVPRPQLPNIASTGVRTVRGVVLSFDPDGPRGTGAIALDVTSSRWFDGQLDQIPMRKHLERDRTFGPLAGHHLAIPMAFSIDYVLTDALAVVAMGDGVLQQLVTAPAAAQAPVAGPPAAGPTVFAVDAHPRAMSEAAWTGLLQLAFGTIRGEDLRPLLAWNAAHLRASLRGSQLVIDASLQRP